MSQILDFKPKPLRQQAEEVLYFLNEKAGRNYKPVDANLDLIIKRLKEGTDVQTMKQVIAMKCRKWKNDDKMDDYLRPKTLFNKTNYWTYEGELDA